MQTEDDLAFMINILNDGKTPRYLYRAVKAKTIQPLLTDQPDGPRERFIPLSEPTQLDHAHTWSWSHAGLPASLTITTRREILPIFGGKKKVIHYQLSFDLEEVAMFLNGTRVGHRVDGSGGRLEFDSPQGINNPRGFENLARLLSVSSNLTS